jgi:antitoxin (DNA-binding transcriptional repressor) of toxin-antitoxin stability system
MKTIGAGALPRAIPRVLDEVKAGERYTVSRRDKGTNWKDEPVAVLLPASYFAERLHRLSEDDLDFLVGDLLSFNADGRGISSQMVEQAKEIRDRLQGERA